MGIPQCSTYFSVSRYSVNGSVRSRQRRTLRQSCYKKQSLQNPAYIQEKASHGRVKAADISAMKTSPTGEKNCGGGGKSLKWDTPIPDPETPESARRGAAVSDALGWEAFRIGCVHQEIHQPLRQATTLWRQQPITKTTFSVPERPVPKLCVPMTGGSLISESTTVLETAEMSGSEIDYMQSLVISNDCRASDTHSRDMKRTIRLHQGQDAGLLLGQRGPTPNRRPALTGLM